MTHAEFAMSIVDQLKRELSVDRIPVSQAISNLVTFTKETNDPFLEGVPSTHPSRKRPGKGLFGC